MPWSKVSGLRGVVKRVIPSFVKGAIWDVFVNLESTTGAGEDVREWVGGGGHRQSPMTIVKKKKTSSSKILRLYFVLASKSSISISHTVIIMFALFDGLVKTVDHLRDHRKSSQKPSKTNKIRLGGLGFSKKSHFGLQMVFCIHIGLRVEAWSANLCLFRGREGVSSETNFVRFTGLLRTFAVAPKRLKFWQIQGR